jgi:hypothetical protein
VKTVRNQNMNYQCLIFLFFIFIFSLGKKMEGIRRGGGSGREKKEGKMGLVTVIVWFLDEKKRSKRES